MICPYWTLRRLKAAWRVTYEKTRQWQSHCFPSSASLYSTFFLSGEPLRNVESSVYLQGVQKICYRRQVGVSLMTSGITDEKHIMRVKSAQCRLKQLSRMRIHIRGFNMKLCGMLYRVFVSSSYKYALHLVPLSLSIKLLIRKLDSWIFRLVMGIVTSRFGSSRLPRLRSLCRL